MIIPNSFFSSVERFVKKVNDWLIKTDSLPIGEFVFIFTNDWPRNNSIKKLKEIINVPVCQ